MTDAVEPSAPTSSIEAEQSVLGALLADDGAFDRVADLLTAVHFASRDHAMIWTAIAGLATARRPVDALTVHEMLRDRGQDEVCGGLAYLAQLAASCSTSRNVRRHAAVVLERYAARMLMHAAEQALEIAGGRGAVAEKVDQITSLFANLQREQVRKVPRSIADIAMERIQEYEALADGQKVAGWATQIPALNRWLNGGFRPGSLYMIGARPGVGKSSLSQQFGMHFAANGLPTLFLSQEMADTEVADRAVANSGRVSYSALLTGKMGREDWARTTEAMESLATLPLFIDDQPALTLRDIRFKAKLVPGLKVLIVDYLQLTASSRRDGNRNAEIEEVTRGLKTLAKELGIAVIVLSQLNRDVEKRPTKRPTLSDLRDSGAVEQDADVVLFLWPVREFPKEGRSIVGLCAEKNRQGARGEVGLDFHGDTQRWAESTADISAPTRNTKDTEL
jgi:replicative DNA helicase